jgi:hypothetical protein
MLFIKVIPWNSKVRKFSSNPKEHEAGSKCAKDNLHHPSLFILCVILISMVTLQSLSLKGMPVK